MRIALTGHLLALSLFFLISNSAHADGASLEPDTVYQPEDVVKIVIEALRSNNQSQNDDGIATVFRFASPQNRAATGPLSRFTNMIKQGFSDMLNQRDSRYDPIDIRGKQALQAVWLMMPDGKEIGYAFHLGKQESGKYAGMWMTESVVPLGFGPNSGTGI